MQWMLPAVIASLGGSLILCGVFAYLYVQYRERHVGIWAWGWFFYALRFVFALCQLLGWHVSEMPHLIQGCVLVSGLFLLWGTNAFVDRRTSPAWLGGALLSGAWTVLSHLGDFSFMAHTLPVFLFYAAISLRTGFVLLHAEELDGPGKQLTGWGLILWGIHKADYPVLRPVAWFAPWGFLLGSLFSFTVALGMLLIYFQKVRRDLVEREAALRSSRKQHRTLLETIPHGVMESDPSGRITFVNSTCCRMRGLTWEKLVGTFLWEISDLPEERERIRGEFLRASRELPEPSGLLVKKLDGDGRPVYLQLDWDYLRNEGGEVAGFVAVVTDVTDRQRADEELRAANQTLESFFRGAPLPVLVLDPQGNVTHWNPSAERVFGWKVGEVLGRPYPLVPPERREEYERHLEVVSRGGELGGVEVTRSRKDGSEIDVRLFTSPVFDSDGQVSGGITIVEEHTERKRMERALRVSEENYRNLAEMSPVPMFVHQKGGFRYLNPAAVELYGASCADRLLGRSILRFIHPHDRSRERDERIRAIPPAQETRRHQFRIVRPDGEVRDLDVTALCIEYGGAPGCLAICLDVTERKRAEAALERKTAILQTLINAIPAPIFYKDVEGLYLGCNRAFEDYLGLPKARIVGKGVHEVAPPELADVYFEADRALLEQGGTQVYETRVRNADGKQRDVIFHKAVFREESGRLGGLVGTMIDITGRKRAEQALRASEKKFREVSAQFQTLLDGIPDSIMLLSPDLRIIWANRGTDNFTDRELRAGESPFCYQLWHRRSGPCDGCPVVASFASARVEEGMVRTADGRTLGVKAFPLKGSGAEVDKVIFLGSDITEKLRLREEADRNSRLASLGELAAGVAHEINNPNGLIALNLPFVRQVFLDALPILEEHRREQGDFPLGGLESSRTLEELPEILEEMQGCSQRIRAIVEDLKNFARAGGPEPEPFELNEAVRTAVRLAGNSIKMACDRFELHLEEDLPPVRGSAQRIEQVAVNLLLNACQSLEEKGKGVRVETAHDPDRGFNLLRVKDEGRGIAGEDLSRVTDPFFTTRREAGGSGLGLAVSARIVREHGGTLHFESVPGEGTEVTVALPVDL